MNSKAESDFLHDLRLVLVGLDRVGKSAAGNTILGREVFESSVSFTSLTLKSENREVELCGRRVMVVDTPGLFNSDISEEEVREEMERALSLSTPGPHAFLLIIQLGRFTEQEKRVMEALQKMFCTTVSEYTIVLFTYGDKLRDTNIDQFIKEDQNLKNLVQKCGGRFHVFSNNDRGNTNQVRELLDKVEHLKIQNMQQYYLKDMKRPRKFWIPSKRLFILGMLMLLVCWSAVSASWKQAVDETNSSRSKNLEGESKLGGTLWDKTQAAGMVMGKGLLFVAGAAAMLLFIKRIRR